MKTTSRRVRNSALRGKSTSHHFVRFSVPWPMSSPQLGVGAGRPNPRKSSATRALMLATITNGANETTGVSAFGRMCRNMIFGSD